MTIRAIVFALSIIGLLTSSITPGFAAGSGDASWTETKSPDLKAAVELIRNEKYDEAQPYLQKALVQEPNDADVYNMLGYSQRKMGNKDKALGYYTKALEINPKHRRANEYLGELYLGLDQPDKAKERLSVLDKSCFFGCDEYTTLKNAIEAYEKKQ
ncbi:tetratricopeptide repeat protein [Kiloniella antarctica]|uniref:Tetratricopeptide repeat protein n=1 Tax=Kiloniella antarctica TaxID=1550907 RepID=A0ABW5BM16_9PROT